MSSLTKVKIYNLALSALNQKREVIDPTTDNSNEVRVLNLHWDIAFESALQDLDLDSTSAPVALELLENLTQTEPDNPWYFVYKYPTKCLFLRRIESGQITDRRSTHIPKRTAVRNGVHVIYTREENAVAECISTDVPLAALNPMAGMAIAYRLAEISAPLLTGKGSSALAQKIRGWYITAKEQAQQHDKLENFNYEADDQRSEFVEARIE